MININAAIILSTKVLNYNILYATIYLNRLFHKIYIILGVVNHDHSYMSEENKWERPEPVDMSTQTEAQSL